MASSSRRKWYKLLGVLLCIAMILSFASLGARAEGDSTSEDDLEATRNHYNELRRQASELDKEIAALDSQISNSKDSAAAKQAQQRANQQKANLLAEQIETKQREIDLREAQIEQQQADIELTREQYDESFELYSQRLVAIYKMNNAGVLSTLLTVDSYTEFLSVTDSLRRISEHDTQMLDEIVENREELERQKQQLEAQLVELEASREELNEDLEELERLNQLLGVQISSELDEIAQSQEELDALKTERAQMQAEMDNIFASLPDSGEDFYGGDLRWPVPGHEGSKYISSGFGWRTLWGVTEFHTGIDIARGDQSYIQGKSIVAALDGTVALVSTSNPSGGYGYYLIIDHGGGIRTLYAHCDSISVGVGDKVTQGTPIATVGNTGRSSGPHLHFELRLNNTEKVDPYPYLVGQGSLY